MSREGLIIGLGNVFPEEGALLRTAEIAVLVEDAHQGEGVGRALMARMLQMAQRLEFEQVSAPLFANNAPIRRLLESTGLKWTTRVSEGIADMTATLPVEPTASDGAAAAPER
jgi:GNAT superfamily N-acetyltransferase